MITSDMFLLTIEMEAFGVSSNAAHCLAILISSLQHKRSCDPKVIIPKDNFENMTNIKTLRILKKHLLDLDKHNFIKLVDNKDHFDVDIMPFLTRLDELKAVYDERMKDKKHPFSD